MKRMMVALVFVAALLAAVAPLPASGALQPCEYFNVTFYSDSSCTQPTGWWNKGCNGQVVMNGVTNTYYTQDMSCCNEVEEPSCPTQCEDYQGCSLTPSGNPPY
jgi:hypothetical protein